VTSFVCEEPLLNLGRISGCTKCSHRRKQRGFPSYNSRGRSCRNQGRPTSRRHGWWYGRNGRHGWYGRHDVNVCRPNPHLARLVSHLLWQQSQTHQCEIQSVRKTLVHHLKKTRLYSGQDVLLWPRAALMTPDMKCERLLSRNPVER